MGVKSVEEHSVTYVLGSRALDLTMVCSTGKCRRSTGFAAAMRYCSSLKKYLFIPGVLTVIFKLQYVPKDLHVRLYID